MGTKGVVETARLELPGTAAAPSVARLFIRNLCEEWGAAALCDVAELLSSELVTNAVVHAHSAISLEAAYDDRLAGDPGGGVLRIEVADRSASDFDLQPHEVTLGEEGGRGLAIVARLANHWGVEPSPSGKRVWFTLQEPA
jgi:anti-sigma regulatory factor (Ser/Thr protein kinase)